MNYEYLTIEDAERLAKKIDEEIAVEYLNSLKKRAFMTMNEIDLANLVIKYKSELTKEIDKNRKAIEYIKKNTEIEHDGDEYGYTEWVEIKPTPQQFIDDLLDILETKEDTPKVSLPSHDYGKSKVYPKEDKNMEKVNGENNE